MKVLGKIGEITLNYQQEKQHEDGSTYFGERYNIFIDCGDDVFMVDSKWLHCQGKGGGREILKRRGIVEGAQGNAIIRFGFRDWNGKRFHEITLEHFELLLNPAQGPAPEGSIAHVLDTKVGGPLLTEKEQVVVDPAPAAEVVKTEEGKDTDLPF